MQLPQRKIIRRKKYDYTSWWIYFVTINTKHREHFFGTIKHGIVWLSSQWILCYRSIQALPTIRETLTLYEYIVMPDHIHLMFHVREGIHPPSLTNGTANAVPYTKQSLWSIIGNFKSMVTRQCNQQWLPFSQQRSYHDRVVRDEKEWYHISNYIMHNPKNWCHEISRNHTKK